jgi:acyl-coenzyme A thioesterase PaaI-like protein
MDNFYFTLRSLSRNRCAGSSPVSGTSQDPLLMGVLALIVTYMNQLHALAQKAKTSAFYLWLLNFILLRTVPFNKSHKLRISSLAENEISIIARNRKYNQNHIKGMHACLLATLCEYVSGLSLTMYLPAGEYRIILKNINMTYHYQAKLDVFVKLRLDKEEMEKTILTPLKTEEAIFREFTVEAYDTANNHICTGLINWQIKAWKNAKLKIS